MTPCYRIVREEGPDHAKVFTAQAVVEETVWGKEAATASKPLSRPPRPPPWPGIAAARRLPHNVQEPPPAGQAEFRVFAAAIPAPAGQPR